MKNMYIKWLQKGRDPSIDGSPLLRVLVRIPNGQDQ